MSRPRALAATSVALFLALVTGCSRGPAEPLPDGASLLNDSATAMRSVQSAHIVLELEGDVTSALPLKRAEGDLLRSGDSKGSLQLSQEGTLIEMEFVLRGDTIYIKGVTGGWQPMPVAVASSIYDPSAILDADRGLVQMLSTATEPKTEAKESVNGTEAYRIAVKPDQQAASSLVPGIRDGATGKLWVDAQNKHLIRVALEVPGSPPGKATLNVSAFDEPVTVDAPTS